MTEFVFFLCSAGHCLPRCGSAAPQEKVEKVCTLCALVSCKTANIFATFSTHSLTSCFSHPPHAHSLTPHSLLTSPSYFTLPHTSHSLTPHTSHSLTSCFSHPPSHLTPPPLTPSPPHSLCATNSFQFVCFLALMLFLTLALVLAARKDDPRRYNQPLDVLRGICEAVSFLAISYNGLAELNQLRM